MPTMSRLLSVFAVLAALLLSGGTDAPAVFPAQPAAAAEPEHAAGVVIDTGEGVKTRCVRFAEDSITGEELLRRADVDAVFAEYGSMGAAVCSLCGTGCPADDCFCEAERSGRYWNYVHASGDGWRSSSRGASSHTIRDGDVDGWAWGGQGSQPPFIPFETVCSQAVSDDGSDPPPASDPPPTGPQQQEEPRAESEPREPAQPTARAAPDDGPTTTQEAEPTPDPTIAAQGSASPPTPPDVSPTPAAGITPDDGPTPAPIVPAPSPTGSLPEALGATAENSFLPLLVFVIVLSVVIGATLFVRRRRDSG